MSHKSRLYTPAEPLVLSGCWAECEEREREVAPVTRDEAVDVAGVRGRRVQAINFGLSSTSSPSSFPASESALHSTSP